MDQLESLCEIEENEEENDEKSSDEDNVEHSSDNEQPQTDTCTGNENHVDGSLDQLGTKGK